MRFYPATLTPDERSGFTVTFRDVPEAITEGDNRREALLHAKDALESALVMYLSERRSLPKNSEPRSGEVMVPVTRIRRSMTLLNARVDHSVRKTRNVGP